MKKNLFILVILFLFTYYIFSYNVNIQTSILNATSLFFYRVFPSLFPMFILSDLFIYFKLPNILAKIFNKIFKNLFNVSSYGAFAFFMSLFCGTPANSYVIKNLVNDKLLTSDEASYIFSFSFFTNPLFYYTMLRQIFKNNNYVVFKLLLVPYFINIIIAFLTKPKHYIQTNYLISNTYKDFSSTLIESIKRSTNTMLMILGCITFFFIINSFINPFNNVLIAGLLEVSQGLNLVSKLDVILLYKEILVLTFVSFGGLSIILQVKSILSDTDISIKKFIKARFLQVLLSITLILVLNLIKL